MNRHVRRAIIMAAPWPLIRACFAPAIVRGSRRHTLNRAAYLAGYAACVIAAAVVFPQLLVPIGFAALYGTLVGLWCTRASLGVRRGLPPGRLPLVAVAPATDHDFYAKQAARLGPIFKTISPVLPNPTVCVVGLPRGLAALRNHEDKLCPIGISFDSLIPKKLLRHMGPDDHRRYRKIFQDAFRDDVVDACLPEIEAIVAAALSGLAETSARDPARGITPRPALERDVALNALLRLFLGLTPGSADAEFTALRLLTIGEDVGGSPGSVRFRQVESAAEEILAVIHGRGEGIATAFANGVEPPPSFLAALLRAHPAELANPTTVLNLVFLLRTATTDLTGLLHWIVKLLGDNPEWLASVRTSAEPAHLAKRVVMETLRLEQSELIFRTAKADIDIDGFVVPAGWHLRVCVHESHRDPAVFDDPERFDPDRFKRRYNRSEYSPLGALGHTCLGVKTVFALAGTFVERLAAGYDMAVVSDGAPEFSMHWRPGRRHRVVLRPVEEAGSLFADGGRLSALGSS